MIFIRHSIWWHLLSLYFFSDRVHVFMYGIVMLTYDHNSWVAMWFTSIHQANDCVLYSSCTGIDLSCQGVGMDRDWFDSDVFQWSRFGTRRNFLHGIQSVQSMNHPWSGHTHTTIPVIHYFNIHLRTLDQAEPANDTIDVVQMGLLFINNEELRSVAIGSIIGHWNYASFIVLQRQEMRE